MRKPSLRSLVPIFLCCSIVALLPMNLTAGPGRTPLKEVYTGTIVAIGGRAGGASTTFNLTITDYTSDEDALKFLGVLEEEKQDGLLRAIRKEKKGFFAIGAQTGRDINVVRVSEMDGRRKITVVFERWMKFAELRGGYRSQDYPFGVLELFVDQNGKGEGTYIGAAQIRMKTDKKTDKSTVEIENFATYPAKLLGVRKRR